MAGAGPQPGSPPLTTGRIQIRRARPPASPALERSGMASPCVSRGLTNTAGDPAPHGQCSFHEKQVTPSCHRYGARLSPVLRRVGFVFAGRPPSGRPPDLPSCPAVGRLTSEADVGRHLRAAPLLRGLVWSCPVAAFPLGRSLVRFSFPFLRGLRKRSAECVDRAFRFLRSSEI